MVLDWHLLSNVLDILYFLLFCTGLSLLPRPKILVILEFKICLKK